MHSFSHNRETGILTILWKLQLRNNKCYYNNHIHKIFIKYWYNIQTKNHWQNVHIFTKTYITPTEEHKSKLTPQSAPPPPVCMTPPWAWWSRPGLSPRRPVWSAPAGWLQAGEGWSPAQGIWLQHPGLDRGLEPWRVKLTTVTTYYGDFDRWMVWRCLTWRRWLTISVVASESLWICVTACRMGSGHSYDSETVSHGDYTI